MNDELSEIAKTCAEIRFNLKILKEEFGIDEIDHTHPMDTDNFKIAFSSINYNLAQIIEELRMRKIW